MQNLLPEGRQNSAAQSNFFLFFALIAMSVLFLMPAKEPPKKIDDGDEAAAVEKAEVDKPDVTAVDAGNETVVTDTSAEPAFVTLGSLDTTAPYRMLVTLTNRGAAVSRIELSDERYRDVHDMSGYFGQIVVDYGALSAAVKGCPVQIVGAGTPAAKAGLQRGDLITTVAFYEGDKVGRSVSIGSFEDLRVVLADSRPKQRIKIQYKRNGETSETDVTLSHAPISVLRPEVSPSTYEEYVKLGGLRGYDPDACDQLSFLTTINAVADVKNAKLAMPATFAQKADRKHDIERDKTLDSELNSVTLRDGNWELASSDNEHATFSKTIPRFNLRMTKTYRIAKVGDDKLGLGEKPESYHLTLTVAIENLGKTEQTVSYQLDGPTGAPLEGAWYSQKSGPGWGSYGIRDVVVNLPSAGPEIISNNVVAFDAIPETWKDETPKYVGVDSKFFQCSLLPVLNDGDDGWVSRLFPIRVGKTQIKWTVLTNNSFRLISKPVTLSAANDVDGSTSGSNVVSHDYTIFAGPKDPNVLTKYGLQNTLSYGWFSWIVKLLLMVLHFFHSFGLNYGLSIILLTIVVRLGMLRLSISQAKSTIKMQELQPEIEKLKVKYKDDPKEMMKAQRELWKKHNYNPFGGCLGLFIQLPIFVALYKALSVDVELYGVSLFSNSFRWCGDLSAPDMLFYWGNFWNWLGLTSFNTGQGMFYLGPYFNLLPILTVILFVVQQRVAMPKPDPSNEQAMMQYKMMNWMMPIMGFFFFKMPSGLCIYFIISTAWAVTERLLLPTKKPSTANVDGAVSEQIIEVELEPQKKPAQQKPPKRERPTQRNEQTPPKEEGYFKRLWREVNEKASERQKLGGTKKVKDRKRKK